MVSLTYCFCVVIHRVVFEYAIVNVNDFARVVSVCVNGFVGVLYLGIFIVILIARVVDLRIIAIAIVSAIVLVQIVVLLRSQFL